MSDEGRPNMRPYTCGVMLPFLAGCIIMSGDMRVIMALVHRVRYSTIAGLLTCG